MLAIIGNVWCLTQNSNSDREALDETLRKQKEKYYLPYIVILSKREEKETLVSQTALGRANKNFSFFL